MAHIGPERLSSMFNCPSFFYDKEMSKATREFHIIGKREDRWLIGLGLGFLTLCLIGFIFHFGGALKHNKVATELLIRDILFFHTIHVPLSFVYLFLLPEFRAWTSQTEQKFFRNFYVDLASVFLIFFSIIFLSKALDGSTSAGAFSFIAFALIQILFQFLHGVGQVRGLSTILNKHILDFDRSYEKPVLHEKYLLRTFAALFTLFGFSYFFKAKASTAELQRLLEPMTNVLYICSILCIVFLISNCFRFPKEVIAKKALFLLRLAMYPFGYFSPLAIFFSSCNHGVEYMFTLRRIHEKSEASLKQKKLLLLSSTIACVLWVGLILLGNEIYFKFNLNQTVLIVFLTTIRAADFTHYWLDRVVFRMREPAARNNQGRLVA